MIDEIEYNLVDIHMHTDMSFDGDENGDFSITKIKEILLKSNEEDDDQSVKMVAFTDHNIFYYKRYLEYREALAPEVKLLPGVEFNIEGKHWLFIFDEDDEKLKRISEGLLKIYSSTIQYDELLNNQTELKTLGEKKFKVEEIFKVLFEIQLDFVAIPHGDKDKGYFKLSEERLKEPLKKINEMIAENIVLGFESKYNESYYTKTIQKINAHIDKAIEENNKLKETYQTEQLDKILMLEKKYGNIANIFGSDFHNRNDKSFEEYKSKKQELFYIKSKLTFYGLKLALLDPESRIYSKERMEKVKKDNLDTYIKSVEVSVNDRVQELKFGDGLNCFIGARGSGKSYFYRALIGDIQKYKESSIYKSVKINRIKLGNNNEVEKVDNKTYDQIKQKSNIKEETNEFDIYELLSDAPYSQDYFVNQVNKIADLINEKDEISEFIEENNKYIEKYNELDKIIIEFESQEDIGRKLLEYNSYMKKIGIEKQIIQQISVAFNQMENELKNIEIHNKKIKKLIDLYKDALEVFKEELPELYNSEEFKSLIINENILIDKLEKILKSDTEKHVENEKIYKILNGILLKVAEQNSNYDNYIDDIRRSLYNNIIKIKKKYMAVNNLRIKIENKKDKKFERVKKYVVKDKNIEFTVSSYFSAKDLSIDKAREIAERYTLTDDDNNLFELIVNDTKKIIDKVDKRRKSLKLESPKLEIEIIIKNAKEEQDFNKLSPGQRAEILLELVLNTNSNKLLFLDQPEDDLDNITIQDVIVKKIRALKSKRQVFVVTHNANICFNADADTITICQKNDKKFDFNQYVLEDDNIIKYTKPNGETIEETPRVVASEILDGGKEALRKRISKIGYQDIVFGGNKDE